ncbi:MAG: magnesium/cobalt transporter CorA [Gemmataceae bacterium]|nr:magnesium/cobalt transporter CorA [Gemmataceae bacterium]
MARAEYNRHRSVREFFPNTGPAVEGRMITVFSWSMEHKTGLWLDAEALRTRAEELHASADVLWIDLDRPDDAEISLVFNDFFPIHPLTIEDVTRGSRHPDAPPHFPKVEEFADYLFVIANPLAPRFRELVLGKADEPGAGGRTATQLSAVITRRILVTHHFEPVLGVEELHRHLCKHGLNAKRGPDYLFHLILDATVDHYAPLLDHFDDALDEMEAGILSRPRPQHLLDLLAIKREIIAFRKTLVYEREVLARLARGEFKLIDRREMVYYRNVYDHLVRFTELIDSSREMVSDLMQTHLAAVSNRLNEIMKVLTMISTIVLPMTLVAGIYGMNFDEMPELRWAYGYPTAIGLMLLSGISSLAFFRWKKWI